MSDPTEPTGLQSQRYERLRVLGSGGQGTVYRAYDHWTGRPVAIKVLNSEAARQPHMAERLSREQQALAALKDTAAVEVLDIYRGSDGALCLVMEFLQGVSLEEYLAGLEAKNERMELGRIAEIFDPIIDTLEVAHKAGIVHRDLKPANVFLLEDGDVRLLDFGMARLKKAAPLTAAGTVMGSPSYIAPEAWGGRSELVDHRADVYSLGVMLFRMLAGALPFSGITLYEKMLGSTKGERPSLFAKRPDLPRDVDEWVVLALAVDPDQRFRNVRALWNAFLITFHVDPPKRGKRKPSLWAKAALKVKEIAGVPDSARSADPLPSGPLLAPSEPSFITQALASSIAPPNTTGPMSLPGVPSSSGERTIELSEKTVELQEKTLELRKPPPASTPEKTAEKTLEISGSELVVDDTLPDPRAVADTLPDGTRAVPSSKKRNERKRRKKERKRRGKGKRKRKA